jgi:hypothetical protein
MRVVPRGSQVWLIREPSPETRLPASGIDPHEEVFILSMAEAQALLDEDRLRAAISEASYHAAQSLEGEIAAAKQRVKDLEDLRLKANDVGKFRSRR